MTSYSKILLPLSKAGTERNKVLSFDWIGFRQSLKTHPTLVHAKKNNSCIAVLRHLKPVLSHEVLSWTLERKSHNFKWYSNQAVVWLYRQCYNVSSQFIKFVQVAQTEWNLCNLHSVKRIKIVTSWSCEFGMWGKIWSGLAEVKCKIHAFFEVKL